MRVAEVGLVGDERVFAHEMHARGIAAELPAGVVFREARCRAALGWDVVKRSSPRACRGLRLLGGADGAGAGRAVSGAPASIQG